MHKTLKRYLTDTAILKMKTEMNDYGEYDYIEKEIKCRIKESFEELYSNNGCYIKCKALIYVNKDTNINVGDLINDEKVIKIIPKKNYKNKIIIKEVLI